MDKTAMSFLDTVFCLVRGAENPNIRMPLTGARVPPAVHGTK